MTSSPKFQITVNELGKTFCDRNEMTKKAYGKKNAHDKQQKEDVKMTIKM